MERRRVVGSEEVCVSLRYNPQSPNAPVVCHLLNQQYNAENDSIQPVSVKAAIAKSLLADSGKTNISKAVVREPQKEIRTVEVVASDSYFSFAVDELGLWALVELK